MGGSGSDLRRRIIDIGDLIRIPNPGSEKFEFGGVLMEEREGGREVTTEAILMGYCDISPLNLFLL